MGTPVALPLLAVSLVFSPLLPLPSPPSHPPLFFSHSGIVFSYLSVSLSIFFYRIRSLSSLFVLICNKSAQLLSHKNLTFRISHLNF